MERYVDQSSAPPRSHCKIGVTPGGRPVRAHSPLAGRTAGPEKCFRVRLMETKNSSDGDVSLVITRPDDDKVGGTEGRVTIDESWLSAFFPVA